MYLGLTRKMLSLIFKISDDKNNPVVLTFIEGGYRRALTGVYSLNSGEGNLFSTKPRFVVDPSNNELKLLPLPISTYQDYLSIIIGYKK